MGIAIRLVHLGLATAGLFIVAAPAAAQTTDPDSTRAASAGVYTAEQAARGETLFKTVCANCHTDSQFYGPDFSKAWSGRPVYSLFDQLRNTMPQDNPGGLSRAEYLSVISYVLKLNTYPTGTAELPDDDAALRLIRFDTALTNQR
jgi:mono/diheme cytochrome c family protein